MFLWPFEASSILYTHTDTHIHTNIQAHTYTQTHIHLFIHLIAQIELLLLFRYFGAFVYFIICSTFLFAGIGGHGFQSNNTNFLYNGFDSTNHVVASK